MNQYSQAKQGTEKDEMMRKLIKSGNEGIIDELIRKVLEKKGYINRKERMKQ